MKPHKKIFRTLIASLAIYISFANSSQALTIDFEDLQQSSSIKIPDGYMGFQWHNLYTTSNAPDSMMGYTPNTLSGKNSAYTRVLDWGGFKAPFKFNVESFTLSMPEKGPLLAFGYIFVQGIRDGNLVRSFETTMGSTSTIYTWGFNDIDTFGISFYGPSPFIIDNIVISGAAVAPIPLPAAVWMFTGGLAALGAAGGLRQRFKQKKIAMTPQPFSDGPSPLLQ